jgi:aquaporin Z
MPLTKRSMAELIGTFWLVLGGCGSAVLAAGILDLGIGYLDVSFAFGLTDVTMAHAVGHISGCHLNPAVSIGLVAGGRFKSSELPHYIIAQVLGAILAAATIYCSPADKKATRWAFLPQTVMARFHRMATRCMPPSCAK